MRVAVRGLVVPPRRRHLRAPRPGVARPGVPPPHPTHHSATTPRHPPLPAPCLERPAQNSPAPPDGRLPLRSPACPLAPGRGESCPAGRRLSPACLARPGISGKSISHAAAGADFAFGKALSRPQLCLLSCIVVVLARALGFSRPLLESSVPLARAVRAVGAARCRPPPTTTPLGAAFPDGLGHSSSTITTVTSLHDQTQQCKARQFVKELERPAQPHTSRGRGKLSRQDRGMAASGVWPHVAVACARRHGSSARPPRGCSAGVTELS